MNTTFKAAFAAAFVMLAAPLAKANGHGKQNIVEIPAADDRKLMAANILHSSTYFKPMLTSMRLCITRTANGCHDQ